MTTIKRRNLGVTYYNEEKSARGFTLYAPQTGNGRVVLINMRGDVEHEWNLPVRPGRDAVILPNGNLGYNGSHEKSIDLYSAWDIWHGGHFMEATPDGDIVWEYEDIFHHHDAQWLENGNILYCAAVKTPDDVFVHKPSNYSDVIREVNREGEIVWEANVYDFIDIDDYPIHECFNNDHWPMVNGILLHEDIIYLSLRTCSGIIGIDKTKKELVSELKYPLVAQQHCPVITDKGLLCFDNGNIRPKSIHHSRAIEYDIDTDEVIWSYVDDMPANFFSPYMGSVQRLWNGNTFICESAFGRLFEVTPEGKVVWEYIIPHFEEYPRPLNSFITGLHNSCFKAHRYPERSL